MLFLSIDATFTVIVQGPLPAGERVPVIVDASMTVEHIKKKILEIFGYSRTSEFDVIMDEMLLLTRDTVRARGIREGQSSFLSVAEQIPCKFNRWTLKQSFTLLTLHQDELKYNGYNNN